jgi:transcription antitermination factor NusG
MEKGKDSRSDIFVKQNNDIKQWHVLYVRSRHEKAINEELVEDGYKTYLPVDKVLRYYSNRKRWVEEPVFKSYLFVKIKRNQLYDIKKNYKYVVSWVKFAGEPAVVSENILLFIKKMLLNKLSYEVENGENVKVGTKIKLKEGAFKGQEGEIVELRGKKKFVVAIKTIGIKLVLNFSDIIPQK